MSNKTPLVSVGLPVYNRPGLLRRALECLRQQSYRDLEIIISDDCSPGEETQKVVQEFMEKEPRIQCYRQEKNLGRDLNTLFVFEKATGEYFFWANDDDEWHEDFVETGVCALLGNPHYGAWCCTYNQIDGFGRVTREFPGFSRFTSTRHKRKDLIKYLLEPEIMGKANIFHGIFRRKALTKTIKEYWVNSNWGADICFSLAFLARFNLVATDEVLHYKRVIGLSDNEKQENLIAIKDPNRYIFPLRESVTYIREHYKAVRTTPCKNFLVLIMLLRLPVAVRNDILSVRALKVLLSRLGRKIKRWLRATNSFLFRDLLWRRKFGYKHDLKTINVEWGTVLTHGAIQVPIDALRALICTSAGKQLMSIEETPHYLWIKALIEGKDDIYARNRYREYLETFYPEEDVETGLARVVTLVSSFRSPSRSDTLIPVVTQPPRLGPGYEYYVVIYDGVHRTAIAKALGHRVIQCRLISNRTKTVSIKREDRFGC